MSTINTHEVHVIEKATKAVIKTMGPTDKRSAEKIASGVSMQMNHISYQVKVVPVKKPTTAAAAATATAATVRTPRRL